MSNFLPNLPFDDVKVVAMSTINRELCKRVGELGIEIIPSETLDKLLAFEKSHIDIQMLHYDKDTVFVLNECTNLKKDLESYFKNIITINKKIERKYPNNVLLNAVSIDNKIICNYDTVDSTIKKKMEQNRTYVYRVKQGYTKCSTCIVTEDSIITSDKSIYNATQNDFDVLLIEPGYIDLPGTNYGFIGGCSFKMNKSILAFTGEIKNHPNYNCIKAFCRNHNVYTESLMNRNLLDIGSIIPIA